MNRPPPYAAALLAALLPAGLRDAVIGDLAEEYEGRAAARGRRRAALWYWRQTAALGGRLVQDRMRRAVRPARRTPGLQPGPGGDGLLRTTLGDVRFGLRHLRRNPGFTATAALVIALGIGANTAILALAHAAFLEPLPYPRAARLGLLSMEFGGLNQGGFSVSYLDMEDVIEGSTAFDEVALFLDWQSVNLAAGGEPQRVPVNFVTPNYFELLGFRAALGRTFQPGDDRAGGAAPVVVLSHGLWQRAFGAADAVLGRTVLLNGLPYTIVGVLAPGAHDLSNRFGHETDVYLPLMAAPALTGLDITERRAARFLYALGRLRDGVTHTMADGQLATIGARLAQAHPASNEGWSFLLRPLREVYFEGSRSLVLLLLGGSLLMLALVCTSLTSLTLIQLSGRTPELSIRLALGAGRGRVARLLVTEAVCLAALGGVCGIAVASWAMGFAGTLDMLTLPGFSRLQVNGTVLLATLALVLAVGISLGLPPALRIFRGGLLDIREAGTRHTDARGRRRRAALVAGEVALACMLLVCAGLLVASFDRLRGTGLGFDTERLLTVRLDLRNDRFANPEVVRQTARRLVDEAAAIPGIRHAFLWSPSRLGGGNWVFFLTRRGEYDLDPLNRVEAARHHIEPQTLGRLGLTLKAGRDFTRTDTAEAPRVAIVSESLARHFWPGEPAVGRTLETRVRSERVLLDIVGVAADARHRSRLEDPFGAQRDIYIPFHQAPERFLSIVVRFEPDASVESLVSTLRRRVLAVDPTLPVYDVQTMAQQMRREEGRARLSTVLMAGYAGLALALAVLGVYGVLAHLVRQERRETGIKLALGASGGTILRGVFVRGFTLVGIGVAAGLAGALAGSRLLDSLLFGVDPHDPRVFAAALAAIVLPAVIACLLPALRAARASPLEALRP